jgi:16S rRNA (cytidine1402-2'-O)-methyltransferase
MAACRELTKIHEEIIRGTASEVYDKLKQRPSVKGEFTLVIHRAEALQNKAELANPRNLKEEVERLTAGGQSRMDAIKQAARQAGLNKREAYDLLEKEKN